MALISQIQTYRNYIGQQLIKQRLIDPSFTIISNNCWGGEVYNHANLRYQTPFIGLFLFAPCYLHLLQNLKEILQSKLTFTQSSRYAIANQNRKDGVWDCYPIGIIGDGIEIHFMHYSNEVEASEKWSRRTQRIHWDNPDRLFFKFCDRGLCTNQFIQAFDQLPYKNKVCFTSQPHPYLQSTVWIRECRMQESVVDGRALYPVCRNYFDVIDWLNGGSGRVSLTQAILNYCLY